MRKEIDGRHSSSSCAWTVFGLRGKLETLRLDCLESFQGIIGHGTLIARLVDDNDRPRIPSRSSRSMTLSTTNAG